MCIIDGRWALHRSRRRPGIRRRRRALQRARLRPGIRRRRGAHQRARLRPGSRRLAEELPIIHISDDETVLDVVCRLLLEKKKKKARYTLLRI